MTDKGEAPARIRRLNEAHEGDHDGGYALVDALVRAHGEADLDGQAQFAEALADFVRAEEPGLWAVALEALVQLGASREVAALGEQALRSSRDEKWKDNVVLGLLRLGQYQFHDPIVAHVRASLASPRTLTVPIIAALCRIDRATCLEISSTYFANAHLGGRQREVEGFIPAFVRNFTSVDDDLLAELAKKVAAQAPAAGRWLAGRLNEYLGKPWILDELGEARTTRIHAAISSATHGVN